MQCVSAINRKAMKIWIGIAGFSILFAFIYEMFSFGVYSIFMLSMPALPIVLGILPSILIPGEMGRLYNDGVLVLMAGFAILGVLEIYGTSSVWPLWMIACGGLLCASGIALKLRSAE